jgi:predicted O-methyltransferase YrrM
MMNDTIALGAPAVLAKIEDAARRIGFDMACDPRTGALLRTLAATRPAGRILELGTGVGTSTAWLLAGMGEAARLTTVDNGLNCIAVARQLLGDDPRLSIHEADGGEFLCSLEGERFDLIFADTWPGKYYQLDDALGLLASGGLYVIDDMLPQPNWPEGHDIKVAALVADLERRSNLLITKLNWSSGIILVTARPVILASQQPNGSSSR